MSLVECAECKKEISDQATSCVHCGVPLEPKKQEITKTSIWIRIAQVYIFIALIRAIFKPYRDGFEGFFYSLGRYIGEPLGIILNLLF